ASDPVVRTPSTAPGGAQPLPAGPPAPSSNMHVWKKFDDPPTPPAGNPTGKPVAAAEPETLGQPRVESPGYLSSIWAHFTNPTACAGGADCGVPCDRCAGDSCGCYDTGNRWYVSAEYLAWWMRGNRVPPLVTTGSITDPVPGALGQPGTQVLFGGNNLGTGAASGARFMAGYWLTRDHCLGLEGGYWFLGSKVNNFSASSQGNPPLFRPFVNETGAEDVELVAVPSPTGPRLTGALSVHS